METTNNENTRNGRVKKWLRRFGIAGFLFFLIKGLVWIGIALFAAKSCNA